MAKRNNFLLLQEKLVAKVNYKYQNIFATVFFLFVEQLTGLGHIQAQCLSRTSKSQPGQSNGLVKASPMDFTADVELAARGVLTKTELRLFHRMIRNVQAPDVVRYTDVAEKVGREFVRRGIYPLSEYFLSKRIIAEGRADDLTV
jgi:hypothetical protein